MKRHLIYHPESNCLFTLWKEEEVKQCLESGQCFDVTDLKEYEARYAKAEGDKTQANREARKKMHEIFISRMIVPSCCNCLFWKEQSEFCDKYKAKPTAHVIVFSCEGWESDIPF